MLAPFAFLAFAAGTLPLQSQSLRNTLAAVADTSASLRHWYSISGVSGEDSILVGIQKALDSITVNHTSQALLENKTAHYLRARLLTTRAAHSGDWLHAIPISSCGLRLIDDELTAATGSMPSQYRHVVSDITVKL